MAKTVIADLFADTLHLAGVERVYGVVGDSLNGLTDSLRKRGKIDWVHMRNEEAAAFAAGAEAQLTGKLAVCAGSCGPGNMHLINGLYDCNRTRELGRSKAFRAVGAANGRNPLSIVAACHRVVGADGTLTGFAGGLAVKRYLLALEAKAGMDQRAG